MKHTLYLCGSGPQTSYPYICTFTNARKMWGFRGQRLNQMRLNSLFFVFLYFAAIEKKKKEKNLSCTGTSPTSAGTRCVDNVTEHTDTHTHVCGVWIIT